MYHPYILSAKTEHLKTDHLTESYLLIACFFPHP